MCPWNLLAGRVEIRQLATNALTMSQRWATVGHLAEEFGVTISFMVSVLVLHGVVERLDDGRIQAPVGIIVKMARRAKVTG